MLFNTLLSDPYTFVTIIIALIMALTVHEAAHAWVSKKLGDDTAESLGRVTLNPIAHLDPLGSIMLLFVGFGWGKPVPVNPNNFKNPVRDELFVALAGPISNFLLACFFAGIVLFFSATMSDQLRDLIKLSGYFNLLLMLFNLIPIPPLDGSKVP